MNTTVIILGFAEHAESYLKSFLKQEAELQFPIKAEKTADGLLKFNNNNWSPIYFELKEKIV